MTKRRGHNVGTVRFRADGRWETQISLRGGKRKTFYGRTRKKMQDKLRAALWDVNAGLELGTSRQTLG